MEDQSFDELTKKLASPISRRGALLAAAATVFGSVFAGMQGTKAFADDNGGNNDNGNGNGNNGNGDGGDGGDGGTGRSNGHCARLGDVCTPNLTCCDHLVCSPSTAGPSRCTCPPGMVAINKRCRCPSGTSFCGFNKDGSANCCNKCQKCDDDHHVCLNRALRPCQTCDPATGQVTGCNVCQTCQQDPTVPGGFSCQPNPNLKCPNCRTCDPTEDHPNCDAPVCPNATCCPIPGTTAVKCCPAPASGCCPGAPNGPCVDLSSDNANCGKCGNTCGKCQKCTNGACASTCPPTCPTGTTCQPVPGSTGQQCDCLCADGSKPCSVVNGVATCCGTCTACVGGTCSPTCSSTCPAGSTCQLDPTTNTCQCVCTNGSRPCVQSDGTLKCCGTCEACGEAGCFSTCTNCPPNTTCTQPAAGGNCQCTCPAGSTCQDPTGAATCCGPCQKCNPLGTPNPGCADVCSPACPPNATCKAVNGTCQCVCANGPPCGNPATGQVCCGSGQTCVNNTCVTQCSTPGTCGHYSGLGCPPGFVCGTCDGGAGCCVNGSGTCDTPNCRTSGDCPPGMVCSFGSVNNGCCPQDPTRTGYCETAG